VRLFSSRWKGKREEELERVVVVGKVERRESSSE
jgi:hypothetical protein